MFSSEFNISRIALIPEKHQCQDERSQRAQGEIYVKIGLIEEALKAAMDKLDRETKEARSACYVSFFVRQQLMLEGM